MTRLIQLPTSRHISLPDNGKRWLTSANDKEQPIRDGHNRCTHPTRTRDNAGEREKTMREQNFMQGTIRPEVDGERPRSSQFTSVAVPHLPES